jgi:MFS family permease
MSGISSASGAVGRPSEWRSGWPLVALTALGLTCAPVTLPVYTLGTFVRPLQAEFGWSRGEIQTAILFSTGLAVIAAPLAGELVRRFGIRRTILSGLVGIAASCALASRLGAALWQLYAAYALMALLGTGAGAVPWTTLIASHFSKARGLALGLALSGTGLCAILMPQIVTWALAMFDWRFAYLALGGFALLVALPACLLVLPREQAGPATASAVRPQQASGMTLRQAVHHWRFWVLGAATACIYMTVGGIIPNLVPAITDQGISPAGAASVMSTFGASVIAGRIVVGALVDRFWAPAVAALVLAPAAAACLILQQDAGIATYAAAAALLGVATGMEFDVLGFLTARYFGLADFPRIYGRLYIFVAASAGSAPLIFGYLFDATGSYDLPLGIGAVLLGLGGVLMLALGRYPDWVSDEDSSTLPPT